jgi:hypothetical protein
MNIYGTSISFPYLPESVGLFTEEGAEPLFWYWRGASGTRYIHSVFLRENCPPLSGAVYIGVKKAGAQRVALVVGRFPGADEGVASVSDFFEDLAAKGVDEVHVHLLASSAAERQRVLDDLAAALYDGGRSD